MLGWKIFIQAVNQIYSNFGMAIRLSAVIWVGIFAINILLAYLFTGRFPNEGLTMEITSSNSSADPYSSNYDPSTPVFIWAWNKIIAILSMIVVYSVGIASIAVSWHRFILLDETSSSMVPKWNWSGTKRYIIVSLKIALMIFVVSFLFGFVISFLASAGVLKSIYVAFFAGFLAAMIISYLWLRVGLALPSAALGVDHTIGNSWDLTQSIKGSIWVLLVILLVLGYVFGDGLRMIIVNKTALFIIGFFTEWIVLMVGVGVLTVLYGHLVEKREL